MPSLPHQRMTPTEARMWTTLLDLVSREHGSALAIGMIVFGWLCGFAFAVVAFWRRISVPICAEERRYLRQYANECDQQIGALLEQNRRLAAKLAEAKANNT